jgi:hypothetical protein
MYVLRLKSEILVILLLHLIHPSSGKLTTITIQYNDRYCAIFNLVESETT